jgi:Zn-dependent peptidase ImmA (M78 family)
MIRRRENRLRSTLAHEFGHVHLHRNVWNEKLRPGELLARDDPTNKAICRRDTIIDAPSYDWMEWQAGYVSGAILVPSSRARRLVGDYCADRGHLPVWSRHGGVLIGIIQEAFEVSEEAARVRLFKLRLITSTDRQPSLFGSGREPLTRHNAELRIFAIDSAAARQLADPRAMRSCVAAADPGDLEWRVLPS